MNASRELILIWYDSLSHENLLFIPVESTARLIKLWIMRAMQDL